MSIFPSPRCHPPHLLTHLGKFSLSSQWCRFDDDKVTPATLAEVFGTSAPIYMAFYVKRRLDYKPYTTPSYVLTRESEAVREREALAAKAHAEQEQVHEFDYVTVMQGRKVPKSSVSPDT